MYKSIIENTLLIYCEKLFDKNNNIYDYKIIDINNFDNISHVDKSELIKKSNELY